MNFGQTADVDQLLKSGDEYFRIRRYVEARTMYEQASLQDTSLYRNQALMLRRAMSWYKTGEYTKAESLLARLKVLDSKYSDYIDFFSAQCLMKIGERDSALRIFSLFQDNYPESVLSDEALYNAGVLLHLQERYRESNQLFRLIYNPSLLINGSNAPAYYKGVNTIKLGNDSAGIVQLLSLIERSPSNTFAVKAVDTIQAIHSEKKKPNTEREIILFVSVYRNNGNTAKAEQWLKEYFQRFPDDTFRGKAYFERGNVRFGQQRYKDAIADFTNAITYCKEPEIARESRLFLARCYSHSGDETKAIREYRRFAREFPNDPKAAEALWTVALLFERSGDAKNALMSYQITAQKPEPNTYRDRALFRVGLSLYKCDSLHSAREHFKNLQQKYPHTDLALQAEFWEAKSLEKLGMMAEACSLYTKLAQRPEQNYYVITARNKISYANHYGEDTKTIFINNTPEMIPKLRDIVLIGLLFGEPWGSRELQRWNKQINTSEASLFALYRVLLEMGIYDGAMRTANIIQNRYYADTTNAEILRLLYPTHYKEYFSNIRLDTISIEESLIYSIIRQESLFKIDAVSPAGALGLMQLMPSTAGAYVTALNKKNIAVEDLFVPEINLTIGINHISALFTRYNGVLPLIVSAYNAGVTIVNTWIKRYGIADLDVFIESIEYSETRSFVKEVLKNYYYYTNLYEKTQK